MVEVPHALQRAVKLPLDVLATMGIQCSSKRCAAAVLARDVANAFANTATSGGFMALTLGAASRQSSHIGRASGAAARAGSPQTWQVAG